MARHPLLPTTTTTALVLLLTILAAGPAWARSDDAARCAEAVAPGAESTRSTGDEAIAACTRALNSADLTRAERARTLNNRGMVHELGGAYDRAFADYLEAVALHRRGGPDDDPASAGYLQPIGFEPDKAVKSGWNSIKSGLGRVGGWFRQHAGTDSKRTTRPQVDYRSYLREQSSTRASSPRPSSPLVADVQRRLNALGFDAGPTDGISGRRTRAAIVAFQESIGVPADGEATEALLARLDDARAFHTADSPPTAGPDARPQVYPAAVPVAEPGPPAPAATAVAAATPAALAPRDLVARPGAPAGRRVALVIGNGAYRHRAPLVNPPRDARAVAAALRRIGFEVSEGIDLDRRGMEDALMEFGREAEDADDALVFYAGHGIQVNGRNYLLPVDTDLEDERDLRRYPTADQVVADAANARRFAAVVLDACRDNPFARSLAMRAATRSLAVGQGLAAPGFTPPNTLIAYATGADAVAADGVGAANSPFTTALLRYLEQPGLDVRLLFGKVRDAVYEATGGQQVPFTYGSLGGSEIHLAGAGR